MPNCEPLSAFVNLWWQVVGDEAIFEVEAAVDAGTWVAFGISGSDTARQMIGADVAVTSLDDQGNARVADYFLTAKSQCNYQEGGTRGVCPDNGVLTCPNAGGKAGSADVTLVKGGRFGTAQRVRYRRKLSTGDACDRAFNTTHGNVVVWGAGPITPAATLVVNIHKHVVSDVVRFNVADTPGIPFTCLAPLNRPVDTPKCAKKQLVTGVTSFPTVTVDNYVSYPNPPSWGVSWQFGTYGETPEIVVERGETYTFKIAATDQHPFYITDNSQGGRLNASERVFAGSADAWGTTAAPHTVTWTVQQDAPATLYYQCWTHIKLGWRIYVVDKGAKVALPADTATECASGPTTAPVTFPVATIVTSSGGCTLLSRFVGAKARLSELQHSLKGVVTIISDCEFRIDGFSYDGRAPDAYLNVGTKAQAPGDATRVRHLKDGEKFDDATLTVRLPAGLTWEGIAGDSGSVRISAWCYAFSAEFGSAFLTPGDTAGTNAGSSALLDVAAIVIAVLVIALK